MPAVRVSDLLRVPPGPIDLHRVDARATPGFDGRKADAEAARAELAERLSTLQEQLYAEGRTGGRRSVLLVLQGMDTSGKGGTVRHVVGQVDPAGVHAVALRPADGRRSAGTTSCGASAGSSRRPARSACSTARTTRTSWPCACAASSTAARGRGATARSTASRPSSPRTGRASSSASCTSRRRSSARGCWPASTTRPSSWKFNPGDLDDRERWDDYLVAYADAIERCNTEVAPWYVVPADRKWYRNWAITRLLIEQLEEMALRWPDPPFDVEEQRARLRAIP